MTYDPQNCSCGHTRSHHVMNPRTRSVDGKCYYGCYKGSEADPCDCKQYQKAAA